MALIKEISLDLTKPQQFVQFTLQQGEAITRQIDAQILDRGDIYTIPSDAICSIRGVNSQGVKFDYPCTVVDNKVRFTITQLMTALAERLPCQIKMILPTSGGIIKTVRFHMLINPSVNIDEFEVTTDEYTQLDNVLLKVSDWDKLFEEAYPNLDSIYANRLNTIDSQFIQIDNQKVNKDEILNGLTAKDGVKTWAELQAMTTGNNIGDYYYCSDGDGINPAGNYRWTGSKFSFGGTGDSGYSNLKTDLVDYGLIENVSLTIKSNGFINASGSYTANASLQLSNPITLKYGDKIIVKARGFASSTCIIAAYHEETNTYNPLVIASVSTKIEYTYKNILSDNLQVVISAYIDTGWSAYIRKSISGADYISSIVESKKLLKEANQYRNYIDFKYGIGGLDGTYKTTLNNQRLVTFEYIDLSTASKIIVKCDDGYSYNINTYSKSGTTYTRVNSYGWKTVPTIFDFSSRTDDYIQMMIMKSDSSVMQLSDINHVHIYSIDSGLIFNTELIDYETLCENVTWSDTEGFIYSASRIGMIYPIKCDFDVVLHLKNPNVDSINYFYFSNDVPLIANKIYTSNWIYNEYVLIPKNTWFSFIVRHIDNSNLGTSALSSMMEIIRSVDSKYLTYITDGGLLPDYYNTNNYLNGKITDIKTLARSCCANGDIFAFITDLHWASNAKKSPLILKHITKNLNLPKIFFGGDIADGYAEVIYPIFRNAFDGKMYGVTGNHDYFNYVKDKDIYYEFNIYNDDAVFGSVERNYYYVDNTKQKIRYIVLNTYSEGTQQFASGDGYETAQIDWFTNVALNVITGWTIIILTHALYNINIDNTYYLANNASNIISAINSYSGNGTIACIIQGHTHRDRVFVLESGVQCVCTTCDKYALHHANEFDVNRTLGTISEQAFDVVLLDKTNRKVSFVRIGAKARDGFGSSSGNEVEIREILY